VYTLYLSTRIVHEEKEKENIFINLSANEGTDVFHGGPCIY
jgi:ferritin-like protein